MVYVYNLMSACVYFLYLYLCAIFMNGRQLLRVLGVSSCYAIWCEVGAVFKHWVMTVGLTHM
jgi:hypothetical protein